MYRIWQQHKKSPTEEGVYLHWSVDENDVVLFSVSPIRNTTYGDILAPMKVVRGTSRHRMENTRMVSGDPGEQERWARLSISANVLNLRPSATLPPAAGRQLGVRATPPPAPRVQNTLFQAGPQHFAPALGTVSKETLFSHCGKRAAPLVASTDQPNTGLPQIRPVTQFVITWIWFPCCSPSARRAPVSLVWKNWGESRIDRKL